MPGSTLRPPRRSGRMTVVLLAVAHIAVDGVAGSVGVVLPALGDRFGLTGTEVGAMVATFAVSALLAQPLGGVVADRFGAHRVTAAGAVVASGLLALVGAAPHPAAVHGLLVVGGFGSAAFHPAAAAVAREGSADRPQTALSLFAAGGLVGLALGPVVGLQVAHVLGLSALALLMIPGVALGAVLAVVLRAPCRVRTERPFDGKQEEGRLWPVVVAGTLASIGVTTFTAGIPLWHAGAAPSTTMAAAVGWSLASFQFAGALGGVAAAGLATRTSPAAIASGALVVAPAPLALSLMVAPRSPAHLALVAVGGALANAATPILLGDAQKRVPQRVAAASGMLMGVTNGLAGVGFIAVGALVDVIGVRPALTVSFGAFIPAALATARSLRSPGHPPTSLPVPRILACTCACSVAAA